MDASQKSIVTIVLISAVVIGTVFCYFFLILYRFQRHHLRNQSALFLSEMKVLEEERTRMARDLHDGLGSILLMIQVCLDQTKGATPADRENLARATGSLDTLRKEIRRILHNLTPRTLLSRGLGTALEDFLEQCAETFGLRYQFRFKLETSLPPEKSIHLFRIVQEIVHNAVKHGQADYLKLELTEHRSTLYLRCRDNGKGFDTAKDYTGNGLQSLQQRTSRMGGSIKFRSTLMAGTEYFFTIPLKQNYGPY